MAASASESGWLAAAALGAGLWDGLSACRCRATVAGTSTSGVRVCPMPGVLLAPEATPQTFQHTSCGTERLSGEELSPQEDAHSIDTS